MVAAKPLRNQDRSAGLSVAERVYCFFTRVETAATQKAGHNGRQHAVDMSAIITLDHPVLGQAIEHMHRRRSAVGKPRNNGFTGADVPISRLEASRPVVLADTGRTAIGRILQP